MIQNRKKKWDRTFVNRSVFDAQRMNSIMVGFVKAADDPQRMGRIRVWIPELGGDPDDEQHWFTCSYASPFAGSTSPRDLTKDGQDMVSSSMSYGWWATPPHLENQVLVCFANGDPAKGFWFACLYQQNMNHMVPGIPSNVPTEQTESGGLPPVVEYNRWTSGSVDDPPRPIFTPLHDGLTSQGLYPDTERGPSSSGARRDTPASVIGFLSKSGHQVYADDSDNGHIRLRTAGGAQVLINDASGYIYVISKQGNSWLEISDSGIDVYSKESISMRAEGDVNLHADKNVNIHAGANINAYAGASAIINAASNVETKAGASIVESAGSNISNKAGSDHLISAGGNVKADAGSNHTVQAGGQSVRQAGTIHDNSGSAGSANAPAAKAISMGTSAGVNTSVARAPAHEPWPLHPRRETTVGATQDASGAAADAPIDADRTQTTGEGQRAVVPPQPDNTPRTVACGGQISGAVLSAIREGATVGGVDLGYMLAKAGQESTFDPNSNRNSSAGAKGLFQFMPGTWREMVTKYGARHNIAMGDLYNPRANAIMGGLYARDNRIALERAGFQGTPRNLYITHMLGTSGGLRLLRASQSSPNASVQSHVSSGAFGGNAGVFRERLGPNRYGATRTVAQTMAFFDRKITDPAGCYSRRFSQ